MRIRSFFLLASLLSLPLLAHPLIADAKPQIGSTYYVSVNGNDSGLGTAEFPWATINHAAAQAHAGDKVVIRGGHYFPSAQIRLPNSGRPGAWIIFAGAQGEHVILDAKNLPRLSFFQKGEPHEGYDNGAFQIQDVSFIRIANISVINSQDAGFTVRDSSYIDLINNSTNKTFSSGIAVWDSTHEGKATRHIRIVGNVIRKPTSWDSAPREVPKSGVAPQEALSIAGAIDFEVAHNEIYDSDEIGIDIKETSKDGTVHQNLVHNVGIGIYVDAWFGTLSDVKIYSNVIHDCQAGFALSVEQGKLVENIDLYNNLVFNNQGSGLYFSRWGANNQRSKIKIFNNTFYHNGYGAPAPGQTYFWMTGGLYLYSTNVRDVIISDNIFSKNRGFQIGYSELFLRGSNSWQAASRAKNIRIIDNVIYGKNASNSPIRSGGNLLDRVKIYAVNGSRAIFADPMFRNASEQDFRLGRNFPAARVGAGPLSLPKLGRITRHLPTVFKSEDH
jgi:hypothetical protein